MKTKLSEEELKARKREQNRRYANSDKGKETRGNYRESSAGKEATTRYVASEKGKDTIKKYNASTSGRGRKEKYNTTPKGVETTRRYNESSAGIERRKRYSATPAGKETRRMGRAKRRARKMEQLCKCCDPNAREQTYATVWVGDDCYICGAPASGTDLVIPLAAGKPGDGLHCLDNFKPACKDCNRSKNAYHYPGTPGWEDFLQSRTVGG